MYRFLILVIVIFGLALCVSCGHGASTVPSSPAQSAATYTISGRVTGLAIDTSPFNPSPTGMWMELDAVSGAESHQTGVKMTVIQAGGVYVFLGVKDGFYKLSPTPQVMYPTSGAADFVFIYSPAIRMVTVSGADVTNLNFVAVGKSTVNPQVSPEG